jgi:flagellar assembly protein FliH
LSRIIKAAELKVLVTSEEQIVIPAIPSEKEGTEGFAKGATILEATNLIEDAQAKAADILARAEEEAHQRLQQAEAEVETLRLRAKEAGFAEGYEEGLEEGRQKALAKASDLLSLLESTVEEAVRLRAASLRALEDDFLKLSVFLADKVIRKAVEADISWLKPIIKEALEVLGTVDQMVVLLNPVDYALLQNYQQDLSLTRTKLVFEQDPSITQGGCLIESETGLIDARLERRLGKLAHHLMEVLYDENNG